MDNEARAKQIKEKRDLVFEKAQIKREEALDKFIKKLPELLQRIIKE